MKSLKKGWKLSDQLCVRCVSWSRSRGCAGENRRRFAFCSLHINQDEVCVCVSVMKGLIYRTAIRGGVREKGCWKIRYIRPGLVDDLDRNIHHFKLTLIRFRRTEWLNRSAAEWRDKKIGKSSKIINSIISH